MGQSERHVHPRAMRESIYLLNYPVVGGFFTTARAGAARAGKPNVFSMGAVVAFTMQGFTAQCRFATGERFSHFRDFNVAKRWIGGEHLLPGFVVLKEKVKWSGLVGRVDRNAGGHGQ